MLIRLHEAVRMLPITRRTLERIERRGLIEFERIQGRVFVDVDLLMKSNIITLGKAAGMVGRSWRTAKRWKDEGLLQVYNPPYSDKGRVSIDAIHIAKERQNARRFAGYQGKAHGESV